MKKSFLILTLLFFSTYCFAQTTFFEGRIIYQNKFTLPSGQDITKIVAKQLGTEQDYYINATNYKSFLNGVAIKMQLYKGKENKYYVVSGDNTVQVFDGTTVTDKINKIEYLSGTFDVLGRKCKGLVMYGSSSKTTYYIDETIRVDPKVYVNHNFGNWNEFMNASKGSLALKFIIENDKYTWEATAIEIEEKKLSDSDFELPKDIKTN
jgi:hypothetical protein